MTKGEKLADEHVEWFLKTLRPLLKSHMVHGYKHGLESQNSTTSPRTNSNSYPDMDVKTESYLSALRVIRTWATYEDGIELVPDDVISLIDRTLKGVETHKTHTWQSDRGWVKR